MNDRFNIPENNAPIEMPESIEEKCELAHKLLIEQFVEQGMPEEVAFATGEMIVQTALNDDKKNKEIVQKQFDMMSAIHNN